MCIWKLTLCVITNKMVAHEILHYSLTSYKWRLNEPTYLGYSWLPDGLLQLVGIWEYSIKDIIIMTHILHFVLRIITANYFGKYLQNQWSQSWHVFANKYYLDLILKENTMKYWCVFRQKIFVRVCSNLRSTTRLHLYNWQRMYKQYKYNNIVYRELWIDTLH